MLKVKVSSCICCYFNSVLCAGGLTNDQQVALGVTIPVVIIGIIILCVVTSIIIYKGGKAMGKVIAF
jgi:hypothetical protein